MLGICLAWQLLKNAFVEAIFSTERIQAMKKCQETNNWWMLDKALGYLLNFLANHKLPISFSDIFKSIADLLNNKELEKEIRKSFSAADIQQMENEKSRNNRLDFTDSPDEVLRALWNCSKNRSTFYKMLEGIIAQKRGKRKKLAASDKILVQKIKELQDTFKLSDFEMETLLVALLLKKDFLTIDAGHQRRTCFDDKLIFFAKVLNCDIETVKRAVTPDGKLRRFSCLDSDMNGNGDLWEFLSGLSKEPLTSQYFRKITAETLPLEFFAELMAKHGDILKEIIHKCNDGAPVNILLYGAPGTGKSSFAHTLAANLNKQCYDIAQNDEKRSDNDFRFAALQVCDSHSIPENSIIVVDEADNMLQGNASSGGFFSLFGMSQSGTKGDKGILNTSMDNLKTPTIWIANTPAQALDESSRRRFDYSIQFKPLSSRQRLTIWRNCVEKMQLAGRISQKQMEEFASKYEVNAGIINLVLRNLLKLSPQQVEVGQVIDKLMTQHCQLLKINLQNDKFLPAKDYSLEGLNLKGEVPLERIVEAIRNFQQDDKTSGLDRPRMNLLLSGAPGTGKTEFVKYLGSALQTKVLIKMGSDLLSMWVGGTEQNIQRVFEEAEQDKAILFLDEIDGLVQSRERAQRSWEVTQVNELLHRMENFNGIMVGATNFSSNLDAAILRRFTFKLEFDFLDDDGKIIFFEKMFQSQITKAERHRLQRIDNLTPGDFRTARQALYYLGGKVTNSMRIDALEQENNAKTKNHYSMKSNKIGF